MVDLIDRQVVVDTIDEVTWYHQNKNGEMVVGAATEHEAWYKADDIYKALKAVPSVDAVEVVRCKNCAKCQVDTIFDQYWCGGERVLPNGFCNYGRRKDG